MYIPDGITLHLHWQTDNPEMDEKIMALWEELKIFPKEIDPKVRVKQVVYCALNEDGKVVAVASTVKTTCPFINLPMLFMRNLVHPDYRLRGLGDLVYGSAIDHLCSLAENGEYMGCKGLGVHVVNRSVQQHNNWAILEPFKTMLIGYLENGDRIRIRYFDGASIHEGQQLSKAHSPMKPLSVEYNLVHHWQTGDPEREKAIKAFWASLNVLPEGTDIEQRVKQVTFCATNSEGQIIGVSSVNKAICPFIKLPMLFLRHLVHPEYRAQNIGLHLMCASIDYFRERSAWGEFEGAKGVATMGVNPVLRNHLKEAVLQHTGLQFIGDLDNGNRVRIRYFDGARL